MMQGKAKQSSGVAFSGIRDLYKRVASLMLSLMPCAGKLVGGDDVEGAKEK